MKYTKNVYRNKLTDAHLDEVMRTARNDKPDLDKIFKSIHFINNSIKTYKHVCENSYFD